MNEEQSRKQRTGQQNKALYKFCELLAEALNDAGWETKRTLLSRPEIEIPWSKNTVKELLWKPVQKAITGKDSTTEMNTVDPSEIYLVVDRHISELTGVSVPWPTNEPPILEK